jgi:2-polyprenyl-3-methyl-5-hydroxy-6-metoxy-1,4-benzoquinol methylase
MKVPQLDPNWPDSWKLSHVYDQYELQGQGTYQGYIYGYRQRFDTTLGLIRQVVPKGSRILDVAAAQGNFSLALAELGYAVAWNDIRAELVDYVRLKWEKGTLEFRPGNILESSMPEQFDAVLIAEVIEHVAYPDRFLKSVARLVRPGGYIIMTTPNGGYFRNNLPRYSDCPDPSQFESRQFGPNGEDHIFLLHVDEVVKFAEQVGLSVREVRLFSNPLTQGHIGLETVLRLIPEGWVKNIEAMSSHLSLSVQQRLCTGMAVLLQIPNPS